MRKPITIGVFGIGFGRQVHVPAFRADSRCVIAGICANRFDRAQRAADELNISKAYRDGREMIEDSSIAAVAIATPPSVQAPLALAAARAGKHLFCEKPLALDHAQAAEILAAAREKHVVHAMDFTFPELDAWQKARQTLQTGGLGAIRQVALTWRVETYSYRVQTGSWKTGSGPDGGTLNNFASHTFYYLEWLLGPISSLAARLTSPPGQSEARADLWLQFAAGFPATVSISADAFLGPGHRLEIYGEDGSLVLENPAATYLRGFTLRVATRAGRAFEEIPAVQPDTQPDDRIAAVSRIARRFLDAIESGGSVTPNLEDGLRVQTLMDAARASDRGSGWQNVAPNK
jgi:predicted dehydrogenase